MSQPVHVIGGGLAGSEAAWQLAQAGDSGDSPRDASGPDDRRAQDRHARRAGLLQLVPLRRQPAQCGRAAAEEMRRCGSLIMRAGDAHKLPRRRARRRSRRFCRGRAGCAASRDAGRDPPRGGAGAARCVRRPGDRRTGPLTSPELAQSIRRATGEDALAFFDAIAPIVHRDSIDFEVAWLQSRYDKPGPAGTGADYVNCPLDEVNTAGSSRCWRRRQARVQGGDLDPYFEGCLPIEVMAERARTRCATGR